MLFLSSQKLINFNFTIRDFKKEFTLKPDKDDKDIFLIYYRMFKLFFAENKKLYLIAHQGKEFYYNKNNLGIFQLKIKERKIELITFYSYQNLYDNLKNNQLYIFKNNSIIIYDILTNTSIQKKLKEEQYFNNLDKILMIDNYILFISLGEVCRWTFRFFCKILDENMDKLCGKPIFSDIYFGLENDLDLSECFIPISDNYFLVNSEIIENRTFINIAEIRIKGKENEIKSEKKLEDIGVFKRHKIEIKDIGKLILYPLDNEKFGINIDNRNIYVYKISGMEFIAKYILNYYDINEKLLLIKTKEKKQNLNYI